MVNIQNGFTWAESHFSGICPIFRQHSYWIKWCLILMIKFLFFFSFYFYKLFVEIINMNYHSEKYLFSSWYTKRYCSNVWTQLIRCFLKFYTISKTESYLFIFAHLIASITVPKVPVLPIPALQWMTNISFFSIASRDHFTKFLNKA